MPRCFPVPALSPLPDIFPLTLDPPVFPFAGDLTLCCKLINFSIVVITPIPPLVLNSTVMALINAQIAIANGLIRALSFPCPRE